MGNPAKQQATTATQCLHPVLLNQRANWKNLGLDFCVFDSAELLPDSVIL